MSPEEILNHPGIKHLHITDANGALHHLSLHSSIPHAAAAANQYFAKWRTSKFRLLQLPGLRSFAILTDTDVVVLAADFPTLAPALLQGKLIFSGNLLMLRALARGTKPTIDMFEPEPLGK